MLKKLISCLLLSLFMVGNSGASNHITFIYVVREYAQIEPGGTYSNPIKTEIHLLGEDREIEIEVPHFYQYALTHHYLAFTDLEGSIYVLNLNSQTLVTLPFKDARFKRDNGSSDSLVWSPQGDKLVFAGLTTQETADIYLYTPETNETINLTQNVNILRLLVNPVAWSTDGKWLSIYGAWREETKEFPDDSYTIPDFSSAIISIETDVFAEIVPETCGLIWSPKMNWLVSETSCFEGFAGGTQRLAIIPFDIEQVIQRATPRIDEIIAPLITDWGDLWISQYYSPLWIDDNTLVVFRRIAAVSLGYFDTEPYYSEGLVQIDLSTYSETLIMEGEFNVRLGNWFVTNGYYDPLVAYNPLLAKTVQFPEFVKHCPVSYALKIDETGQYVALIDACTPPDAGQPHRMVLYETETFTEIFSAEITTLKSVRPLGFISDN